MAASQTCWTAFGDENGDCATHTPLGYTTRGFGLRTTTFRHVQQFDNKRFDGTESKSSKETPAPQPRHVRKVTLHPPASGPMEAEATTL